ncbi:MAG: hypothetical protein PHP98_04785 [Kiritimatiellae bacterium]|nr:hypothetical protein [Kiritimatiellia bacterium]
MEKQYPLRELWQGMENRLKKSRANPSGAHRELYLDLAEKIIRTAAKWQNEEGMIIDPCMKAEANSGSARFVGGLGQLIRAGRCLDMIEICVRSYEHCLSRLDEARTSPEFWTKELMYAYEGLKNHIEPDRLDRWNQIWRAHQPRKCYGGIVRKQKNNFLVFAAIGEFLKSLSGLGGDMEMADECLEILMGDFTEYGMYRDPNDPMAYDLVVRQQMDLMLSRGYQGRQAALIREICRRGGLTSLLYQSVTGQTPFGGRSNQYHWAEGHFSCMCESQARYYKSQGKTLLAGAFKRAARRAALSTKAWTLKMEPYRHLKQGFHPKLMHGIDSYGNIGVYGLLAASLFGTAYHLADETIEERVTPAEIGGYAFDLWPAFHKIFASCGGYHLEIDTKADHHYDSTGLGRIQKIGVWPETALSGSLTRDCNYITHTKDDYKNANPLLKTFAGSRSCEADIKSFARETVKNLAFGPAWRDAAGTERRLADFDREIKDVKMRLLHADEREVAFEVEYFGDLGGCSRIVEHYQISATGIQYGVALDPVSIKPYILVPLIQTDGMEAARLDKKSGRISLVYRGARYEIATGRGGRTEILPDAAMPNRNALYRTGRFDDNCVIATLTDKKSDIR